MGKITQRIEWEEKHLSKRKEAVALLSKLVHAENSLPAEVQVSLTNDGILFNDIPDMQILHEMRTWLKDNLGSWQDNLQTIWYSCGRMLASFEGENYPIVLWIETYPENFPKELQSDKCKVVRMSDEVTPQYDYVCQVNEEDG